MSSEIITNEQINDNKDRQSYQAALKFLAERTKFGINLGLRRIERLLELLDNPERGAGAPRFIHVGGTNGKGSVSAMLAAMLQSGGWRTGLFTSPHLHTYRERFRLNGELISEAELVQELADIQPLLTALEEAGEEAPTEFEVGTALALHWFRRRRADWAVMEVGLGGAIDSTNVIMPELAVITNVAMDHMDYLGNTLTEIAQVKAGIIKPGVPALTAAQDEEVLAVLRRRAEAQGSRLWQLGRDFDYEAEQTSACGQRFSYCDWHSGERWPGLTINLLGEHQLANAALAVAAARQLGLKEEAVRRGLAAACWPGRLEIISRQPLIVLDGAHNVAGMQALNAALRQYWPGRKIVAVLGMLADKERAAAMRLLLPLVSQAVITRAPSPRAGDWQSLATICQACGVPCRLEEQVAQAVATGQFLAAAAQSEQAAEPLLLITGSLYMLAEARACLLGLEQEIY